MNRNETDSNSDHGDLVDGLENLLDPAAEITYLKHDVFMPMKSGSNYFGSNESNGFKSPSIDDLLAYTHSQSNVSERAKSIASDKQDTAQQSHVDTHLFLFAEGSTESMQLLDDINPSNTQSKSRTTISTRRKPKCCAHCGITTAPGIVIINISRERV